MASTKPPPILPEGATSSLLSSLSETFAFHSSPEAFISKRIQALQSQSQSPNPLVATPKVLRARILNRNVAVVTTYSQIAHVLQQQHAHAASTDGCEEEEEKPTFVASAAYADFMAPFFPSPNLLLADGSAHASMRAAWEQRVASMTARLRGQVTGHVQELFAADNLGSHGQSIDLYSSLKTLAWRILLGVFLNLRHDDAEFATIERLQEELLRGQFSLFPVSITTPFWKSARRKGILAKEALQTVLLRRLTHVASACPFHQQQQPAGVRIGRGADDMAEMANHVLLFTSSLSVKALASLLTAFMLNLSLFDAAGDGGSSTSLLSGVQKAGPAESEEQLDSILRETERLSPPIVGIMRRATRDTLIPTTSRDDDTADTLIPNGWDVWLYLIGAGRDTAAFGPDYATFRPSRWMERNGNEIPAANMAYSTGPKVCLGQEVVREIVLAVGSAFAAMDLKITGEVKAKGVRAWLGWEAGESAVDDWARDVKQLPTQHPAEPIFVQISRGD